MRVGYPCINRSIGCTANSTFRLRSYSEERMRKAIESNLACLSRILHYNAEKGFFFFRISSDIVPFASHPVCRFRWQRHFRDEFAEIGGYIRKQKMRISMHPDQFVLLNSPDRGVTERSVKELEYHCDVLDAIGLDRTAKVQIHIGGVYGDKPKAMERFCERYGGLPGRIRERLAIENDHRLYSLHDCLGMYGRLGVPVIFDSFHHECLNNGESIREGAEKAAKTWRKGDGPLMMDYSSQKKGAMPGTHAESIDIRHFRKFLREMEGMDYDLMLEIKDKEKSATKALKEVKKDWLTSS